MLVIQMPDSGERKRKERRRRQRALLYLVPCPLILWAIFAAAPNLWWMLAGIVVEQWWVWAVWTDLRP